MLLRFLAISLALTGAGFAQTDAPLPPDQAAMKSHVLFLASDAMRGRDTGSPEYAIAAQYVAAQFEAAGLRPAGDSGSYLQDVPLVSYKTADQGSFVLTKRGAKPMPLVFGEDYYPAADPTRPVTSADASLAFAGFGLIAPDIGRDDYKGVDVRGRIVLIFAGAPASMNGEERAHFGSTATKVASAAAKGATGVVLIDRPSGTPEGFAKRAQAYDRPQIAWVGKGGAGPGISPGTPLLGTISTVAAAKLFGKSWGKIAERGQSPETRFAPQLLDARLSAVTRSSATPLPSWNVAGLLPGSDAKLGQEVVVLSAHLDHIGVDAAAKGDQIRNGAMDNAVGIAALIEEAKHFAASGKLPRRSILFLAVTAEEKGLVGSDYFATHPSVPHGRLVADVNLDMPIITYPFEDVIAFGAERSTLGPIVKRAAASLGVGFGPDPSPEQGLFVRSDHYRFVQRGIPSVFLWPGQKGPGKAAVEAFFKAHYHQPSDEIVQSPPIDWAQGVRFVQANYAIAREIADADERPRWNKGDFFGMLYGGYGAR